MKTKRKRKKDFFLSFFNKWPHGPTKKCHMALLIEGQTERLTKQLHLRVQGLLVLKNKLRDQIANKRKVQGIMVPKNLNFSRLEKEFKDGCFHAARDSKFSLAYSIQSFKTMYMFPTKHQPKFEGSNFVTLGLPKSIKKAMTFLVLSPKGHFESWTSQAQAYCLLRSRNSQPR